MRVFYGDNICFGSWIPLPEDLLADDWMIVGKTVKTTRMYEYGGTIVRLTIEHDDRIEFTDKMLVDMGQAKIGRTSIPDYRSIPHEKDEKVDDNNNGH